MIQNLLKLAALLCVVALAGCQKQPENLPVANVVEKESLKLKLNVYHMAIASTNLVIQANFIRSDFSTEEMHLSLTIIDQSLERIGTDATDPKTEEMRSKLRETLTLEHELALARLAELSNEIDKFQQSVKDCRAEFNEVYAERVLVDTRALDQIDAAERLVPEMRARLRAIESDWEKYMRGEPLTR